MKRKLRIRARSLIDDDEDNTETLSFFGADEFVGCIIHLRRETIFKKEKK